MTIKRLLIPTAMLALIGIGSFVIQRDLAETMKAAVVLSVVWGGLVAGSALAYARTRRQLMVPIIAALGLAVIGAGFSAWYFMRDDIVDEDVVVATRSADAATAQQALSGAAADGSEPAAPPAQPTPPAGPVNLARGTFAGADDHAGSGTATVVRKASGERVLTFTEFDVSPGVDVDVYLSTSSDDLSDHVNLGGLKGNVGDQQYGIPADLDLTRYRHVVLYCIPFTVRIAVAELS